MVSFKGPLKLILFYFISLLFSLSRALRFKYKLIWPDFKSKILSKTFLVANNHEVMTVLNSLVTMKLVLLVPIETSVHKDFAIKKKEKEEIYMPACAVFVDYVLS